MSSALSTSLASSSASVTSSHARLGSSPGVLIVRELFFIVQVAFVISVQALILDVIAEQGSQQSFRPGSGAFGDSLDHLVTKEVLAFTFLPIRYIEWDAVLDTIIVKVREPSRG